MSCDFKIKILSEKEVLESIYGKGFGYWRMKLPLGSSVHVDASKQSVWANMPPELLRAVLMKIEESESFWPERQDVVACAGVCRNWRDIMKDIVKPVKISRMLTFPESVKQPGPRDKLIQCYIYRDPSNQSYHLYLSKYPTIYCYGKFLLSARKYRRPTCTDYNIYLTKHNVRMNNYYIGKLSSNIIGTKFIIYDTEDPKAGQLLNAAGRVKCRSARVGMKQVSLRGSIRDFPIAHISYELNVLGSRVPRRMHCVMTAIPLCAAEEAETEFVRRVDYPFPLFRSKSVSGSMSTAKDGILMLKNKTPKWHEQLQCWCLNFNGRVTVASVKNFQLVACVDNTPIGLEPEKVVLQFGKVGKDVFTLDYQYPLSAFQAFAICLTSFDTKIASDD